MKAENFLNFFVVVVFLLYMLQNKLANSTIDIIGLVKVL